jgi:hypothetical protein
MTMKINILVIQSWPVINLLSLESLSLSINMLLTRSITLPGANAGKDFRSLSLLLESPSLAGLPLWSKVRKTKVISKPS